MEYTYKSGRTVYAYSQEERAEALTTSLTALARELGYTPTRCGSHYSLKEMDSLIIYNDVSWRRWSGKGNRTGGSQIDFLLEFGNVSSVPEAVNYLLRFQGKAPERIAAAERQNDRKTPTSEFVLPEKNDNYRRLYAYLIKTRKLSPEIVNDFVHRGLIYESKEHHNLVFCGMDKQGTVRYAGMRGTSNLPGKAFKCDVPGNDKNYGVCIVNRSSSELKVFEGVIDCMSYIDMYQDHSSNMLILGMVADNPLQQFLKDYDHISSITFCLDNDAAGKKAMFGTDKRDPATGKISHETGLIEKYEQLGYAVDYELPLQGKDFNESLIIWKSEKEMNVRDNKSYVEQFYEKMMNVCGYFRQRINPEEEMATVKFINAAGRTFLSDGYGDCAAWLLRDQNLTDSQKKQVNQMDRQTRTIHLLKNDGLITRFYMDQCPNEQYTLFDTDGYKYTEDNMYRIYYDFDGLLTAREMDELKSFCTLQNKKENQNMKQSDNNELLRSNLETVRRNRGR